MKKVLDLGRSAVHLVVAILLLMGPQLIAQKIVTSLFQKNPIALYLAYVILYLVMTSLLTLLYAKFTERLSYEDMSINRSPGWLPLGIGLVLPLAVTAFYLLFTDGEFVHTSSEVALILVSVTLTSAVAGITEEIVFRGMLMRSLMKRWGTVVGIVAPSFLFAAIHIIMMSEVTAISYLMLLVSGTLVGIMFSLLVLYSESIWASVIVHSLWNVIIIGGILSIHASGSGVTEQALYEYQITSQNLFLTGGIYGIECSLPAMIGFVIVSAILLLLKKGKRLEK